MARVLIVEDDPAGRALLRQLVEEDHDVFECADGKSALATAKSQVPDLILLDLGLPDMDGWQVARQLRTLPEFLSTPIIAVTGHVTQDQWESAQRAGCTDRVPKPIDEEELLAKIGEYLKTDPSKT
jgi:CheY-like chemotaxis protein